MRTAGIRESGLATRLAVLALAAWLGAAAISTAQEHDGHHGTAGGEPGEAERGAPHGHEPAAALELAPELRQKLVAEMVAVQAAVRRIVDGIAFGDWKAVGEAARGIDESYILRKELSAAEREALHRALPPDFRRLDAAFHRDAARLAEAAAHGDGDLVTFRFYKLLDGCVTCHRAYAGHRFPGHANPGP